MGERGWEICQYERKDAFRKSATVASHLKFGEANRTLDLQLNLKKREMGEALTTPGPCAGLVSLLQLGSFIQFYQPLSPQQHLHLCVPFVFPCTTVFCSGHRMTLLGHLT